MNWLYGYLLLGMLLALWQHWRSGSATATVDAVLILFGYNGNIWTRVLAITGFWFLTLSAWPIPILMRLGGWARRASK